MYVSIVLLPFLAALISGFFGRFLGTKGVHIFNVTCILITTLLAFVAFYEVVLCNSPVSVELFPWVLLDSTQIHWSFYYDELTVGMLIPVLIVSLLVHLYSVGYMGEDPHQQRFFSYISLFTGLMLILVTGSNFLVMFLGWEGVGVCSYLLVHFWYTRVSAVKSAMNAMFTNRVGDYFLTLGFFAIFYTFGTLDYSTVFSLAPYISTNVITFISILLLLGAAAKSAQLSLHGWLPYAMEGPRTHENLNWKIKNINSFKNIVIRKYSSKALKVGISDNKKFSNPNPNSKIMAMLIGDLLGDGHIRLNNKQSLGRMEFTFSTQNLPYVNYLKFVAYDKICTTTKPTPWPNPNTGKEVTQYWFSSRFLPFIRELHKNWYIKIKDKNVKVVPKNIGELLKPAGLAHWIMGDGYCSHNAVHLCTDSFTEVEVELLIKVLYVNFGLLATKSIRKLESGVICWRIRMPTSETFKLQNIVARYMIPEMLYKINMNK